MLETMEVVIRGNVTEREVDHKYQDEGGMLKSVPVLHENEEFVELFGTTPMIIQY